jgi:hypothetical protein
VTDLPTIEFEVKTPLDQRGLRSHVAWSTRQGLVEVHEGRLRDDVVNIIANGPSALDAPLEGLTCALNGALKVFTEKGLAPTFWAGCDPQPLMVNFVKQAPAETVYLVASKCHKSVFNALKRRDVRLWHIDDTDGHPWAVPTATSITLTAMSLFRRMGYQHFRLWGWDGCYLDGKDHANPQPHHGDPVTVWVGDQPFRTTGTWALEAQDAVHQLRLGDYFVSVEGPGMIGAVLKALAPEVLMDPSRFNPGKTGS